MDLFERPQAMNILKILLDGEKNIETIRKQMINRYDNYPAYSNVHKNVNELEVMELVSMKKEGREVKVTLKPKGELIARLLKEVGEALC